MFSIVYSIYYFNIVTFTIPLYFFRKLNKFSNSCSILCVCTTVLVFRLVRVSVNFKFNVSRVWHFRDSATYGRNSRATYLFVCFMSENDLTFGAR